MRKIFIMGLLAIFVMQACKKDQELIDGKRPEERVAQELEKYRNELVNSPNGWVAYLNTTIVGGGYGFYMAFDKENKVIMRADYDSDIALELVESTYRVKQVMAPSIIFDTYNLLHLLQDPDPSFFDGDYAVGYGSDFEFEIREQIGDTIKLVGKKRGASLILVKATADEKTVFTTDLFSESIDEITNYLAAHPFTYILDPKDNTKKILVSVKSDVRSRQFQFISLNGTEAVINSGAFSFSASGMRLIKPILVSGVNYTNVTWDKVASKLFLVSQSGTKTEILFSNDALFPLDVLLGPVFSAVTVPNATNYPGWGSEFVTRRALVNQRLNANIVVGGIPISLGAMSFNFNTTTKVMTLLINTPFGGNSLNLTYPYNFTKNASGVYKFTIIPGFDSNSTFVYSQVSKPLDPLLLERINVDTFKLEYFVNPTTGAVMARFVSVEHPNFTFSGALQ
jgi:hypothetical protein